MARWLVELSGEPFDLEEYPRQFPDGDVFVIEENGTFFLAGRAFEVLSTPDAILSEAVRALDRFSAVISLLLPSLKKATATSVFRETDDGSRSVFVFPSGVSARSKAGAVGVCIGAPPQPPQPTQAQELLRRATGNPHLERALSLWADPIRSWPRLYCVIEEVERHLGKRVDAAGLCSGGQRERFRRTADSAEVSGADARHAAGKFDPPKNPMNLAEATRFVEQVLLGVLR
jgi:hypothetical protein